MDRKSIPLIVIVVMILLLATRLINRAFPPIPVPVSTNQVVTATKTKLHPAPMRR